MKRFKQSVALLLAVAIALSMVYIAPQTVQAAPADYISASYASSLSVRTTRTVGLYECPTTDYAAAHTLSADTMLTVKGLHLSGSGEYWYEVLYYGLTLYVQAAAVTMEDHLTGDVTISDVRAPASLDIDTAFPIEGNIQSTLNDLGTVTAAMYSGSDLTRLPALSASDNAGGKSYSLKSSTVDKKLAFSSLAAGVYTYVITAQAVSYYIENGSLTTSAQTVVLEQQQCVITDWENPNPALARGIDVSFWQGDIDWAAASKEIDYAVIRLGYLNGIDSKFLRNVQGCIDNGIPFGIYLFSYALTPEKALQEAEYTIETLQYYGIEPDLPVWFDFETEDQMALSSSVMSDIVKTYCETIRDAGYDPGLYTYIWINSGYLTDSYFDTLPIWVAQISNFSEDGTSTYDGGTWMWQYSFEGSVSGITGNVDLDYCYAEIPGITSDTSYLSQCTYYPTNATLTTTGAVNMRQYPSANYTALTVLPSGTQVHATGLYVNTGGGYWYQVEHNGKTGYISAAFASVETFLHDDLAVVAPAMTDNLSVGSSYYLSGELVSLYNQIGTACAKVYSGEDTLAAPVLNSSAAVGGRSYGLYKSAVDKGLSFGKLSSGYYTYEISADVTSYYYDGGLVAATENVVLWTAPFTVGGVAVTPPADSGCDHTPVTDAAVEATCTASGLTEGSHCSSCGATITAQLVIPAVGHSYTAQVFEATCLQSAFTRYTCANCGDSYDVAVEWQETKPEGVDEGLIETKTQYRYANVTETVTSFDTSMDGYVQLSWSWLQTGAYTYKYVPGWPSGFDTGHSLYSTYNDGPMSDSETETEKKTVISNTLTGYIYYHWCDSSVTSSSAISTGVYDTFHAYYSTTAPSNYPCDTSDMSYKTSNTCCSNTAWFCAVEVYHQIYRLFQPQYTYGLLGEWSQWSDQVYTATDTQVVETRTLYRVAGGELADHAWADGLCTVCGTVCEHSYSDNACIHCGQILVIPTLTLNRATVSFDGVVCMNIYYSGTNLDTLELEDMGLLTWTTPNSEGVFSNARAVIPGAKYNGNEYMVHTNGIAAKNLGDIVYFKVYARLSDGTYVYSALQAYSPKAYALAVASSTAFSDDIRALCVAMLNYGAAAQTYFGYKPYDLMNASLTAEQLALVKSYDQTMVDGIVAADSSMTGGFPSAGFSNMYPSISFEGAFAINYYFTNSLTPDEGITFYYWDAATYESQSELTTENATGSMAMVQDGSRWWAEVADIAAKRLDETVYVAGVYTSGGVSYTTGVIAYSLGRYCEIIAGDAAYDAQPLAAATAVYGYYAKTYFAKLYG